MQKQLFILAIALFLAGCRTTSSPQFCGLERGMSEKDFLSVRLDRNCSIDRTFYDRDPVYRFSETVVTLDVNGKMPVPEITDDPLADALPARSLTVDGDRWTVWRYHVAQLFSLRGHDEYVVFRNHRLVTWGLGKPPREFLDHPEQLVDK